MLCVCEEGQAACEGLLWVDHPSSGGGEHKVFAVSWERLYGASTLSLDSKVSVSEPPGRVTDSTRSLSSIFSMVKAASRADSTRGLSSIFSMMRATFARVS